MKSITCDTFSSPPLPTTPHESCMWWTISESRQLPSIPSVREFGYHTKLPHHILRMNSDNQLPNRPIVFGLMFQSHAGDPKWYNKNGTESFNDPKLAGWLSSPYIVWKKISMRPRIWVSCSADSIEKWSWRICFATMTKFLFRYLSIYFISRIVLGWQASPCEAAQYSELATPATTTHPMRMSSIMWRARDDFDWWVKRSD